MSLFIITIEYYQPPLRGVHSTVVINDKVYMWGGWQIGLPKVHNSAEKRKITSHIDVFDITDGIWETKPTAGTPPLGVYDYACTSIRNGIYFFGGDCGHKGCYHNSLNGLNVDSLQWTQISPTTDKEGLPMKKAVSGMIIFTCDNEDIALIVGGRGLPTKTPQPNAIYIAQDNGDVVTNEHHIYNFSKCEQTTLTYTLT